jgi:putative Mn2+ efflux pump MntP
MLQLAAFSLLLSVIHVLVPHHWLPLALLAKSEKWNRQQTLQLSVIVSFSHVISTIILGIFIGIIGMEAAKKMGEFTEWFAPLLLILFGIIYVSLGDNHKHEDGVKLKTHSYGRIVFSMSVAMFFSPCLEVETFYFTAGTFGWKGITIVSLIYLAITVSGISILTLSGKKTIDRFNLHFLEHYEKKITGVILILLGILSYFVKF